MAWFEERGLLNEVTGIAHRVVHGGPNYSESVVITDEVITELQRLVSFDPEHMPVQIQLIDLLRRSYPGITNVACFDTAFHHNLPTVARLLPIPRRYEAQGIRRYGFHGLSYRYLLDELGRVAGPEAPQAKVILAHLGNGASITAVKGGVSIDTSMGLTPAGGFPMSTRSGDLDPGLVARLVEQDGLSAEQLNHLVGFESGLLGISETTGDMKQLLDVEDQDSRAADAINIFCYQLKKYIGAYAAVMGGLDTLIFTGGIGEPSWKIRARVCEGLECLGIELDEERNRNGADIITRDGSRACVRVIHTDEAMTMIRDLAKILKEQA